MKENLQRLAAVLCASILCFLATTVQAEQRPAMTSHVPEAVASGVAPLVGHLSGTQRLSLAISLPLRNEAGLDDLLQQIYDPQNPNYHVYLSVAEFTARFGPSEADYADMRSFAEANGLKVIDTAATRHPPKSRTSSARDREPTLDLDVPVLHVSGLDNFTLPHAKNIRSSQQSGAIGKTTGSGPGGNFIGSDMRAAYYGS